MRKCKLPIRESVPNLRLADLVYSGAVMSLVYSVMRFCKNLHRASSQSWINLTVMNLFHLSILKNLGC
jgi:hypothetical protein